jgi:DNA replicative helicase MCM subunit Mcm2 (Cdc46/Mcm family)
VLAAANPLYGTYDRKSSINMNVSLPDSLLSRFDMLFVVLDNTNTAMDKEVRRRACSVHVSVHQHSHGQGGTRPRTCSSVMLCLWFLHYLLVWAINTSSQALP